MKKSKSKKKVDREPGLTEALDAALAAEPKDIKVHISLRLDSDIYMELQRRAEAGEAKGKYQALLNQLLRRVLFEQFDDSEVADQDLFASLERYMRARGYKGTSEKRDKSIPEQTRLMKRPQAIKERHYVARAGKK